MPDAPTPPGPVKLGLDDLDRVVGGCGMQTPSLQSTETPMFTVAPSGGGTPEGGTTGIGGTSLSSMMVTMGGVGVDTDVLLVHIAMAMRDTQNTANGASNTQDQQARADLFKSKFSP